MGAISIHIGLKFGATAISKLLEALDSSKWSVRYGALDSIKILVNLQLLSPKEQEEISLRLITLLDDKMGWRYGTVNEMAADTLGAMGLNARNAIEPLKDLVWNTTPSGSDRFSIPNLDDLSQKIAALRALENILNKDERLVEYLFEFFEYYPDYTTYEILIDLGIDSSEVQEHLIKPLQSSSAVKNIGALHVLGRILSTYNSNADVWKDIFREVRKLTEHEDHYIRHLANEIRSCMVNVVCE